jgi:hypothetical protein
VEPKVRFKATKTPINNSLFFQGGTTVDEELVVVPSPAELWLRVAVVVIVIGAVVLENRYLLLRQPHAELICVAISPSLHSVVSGYVCVMLLANDEQNSRPRRSFAGSNARRQLFALHPSPYSSTGKLVTVDVKKVVWFPSVESVVRETCPAEVPEVLNVVLDVLANGGRDVVLNVDVVSVKVLVLKGADVIMEVSDELVKEVLDRIVVDASVEDVGNVVDVSDEAVNDVLERLVVDSSAEDAVSVEDVVDEFANDVLDRLVVGPVKDVFDIVVEVSDKLIKDVLERLAVGASVVDVFEKNVKDKGVPVVMLEVVALPLSVEVEVVAVALIPKFKDTRVVEEELVVTLVAVELENPEVELLDVVSNVNVVEEELLDKLEDRLELRLVDRLEDRLLDTLLDILEKQLAGQGDVAEE